MKKIRRFNIVIFLLFLTYLLYSCFKEQNNNKYKLIILYTNDIHCNYENYPLLGTYKETLRSKDENIILIDGGDFVQGNPSGTIDKGENMIRLMNAASYDYAVPGNHDYDYGMDAFIKNANNANFQWISCNYSGKDKYEKAFIHEAYKIIDVGKHRIALIGIEYEKEINNYIDKVKKAITDAKAKGSDFVIAIGHTGEDTKKIIENTTGINIYLNAHDHALNDAKESILNYQNMDGIDVPVFETGTNFKYVGELVLNCKEKDICYDFELKTIGDLNSEMSVNIPESAVKIRNKCEEIVDKCNKTMENYKVEIGNCECILYVYDPTRFPDYVNNIEYNSTDFIADAFRVVGNTDIGLVNIDSVRVGLIPGIVTRLDICNLFPWNSKVYTTNLSGQQIIEILEYNLRNYPAYTPASPAVSGMTFTIDPSIPWTENTNKRIKSVMIGKEPIDLNKMYSVSSSEYYLFNGNKDILEKTANDCIYIGMDYDVIETYIKKDLNGIIPKSIYSDPSGLHRIN